MSKDDHKAIQLVAEMSINQSDRTIKKLLGPETHLSMNNVQVKDITAITEEVNRNNDEVVGAFIDLIGDAPFKYLIYVKQSDAYLLADIMLKRPAGTTKKYDIYTSSTIQEIGNIIASCITNVFVNNYPIILKPSPPVVVNDYVGTIFAEFLMATAVQNDQVLLIDTNFSVLNNSIYCKMFLFPMPGSERILEMMIY